ncbi:MAG: NAD-dependent epimerase/dehydratase family protein [Gammaproteobacteria bacterium]|nr:MAG: NAD-dependent epimerase/dehydratase family protein [Gammaproteobacteria bacterium]
MGREMILLTGATGYLGRHLCHHLLDRGYRVTTLVRGRQEGMRARLAQALGPLGREPGVVEAFEGDITLPDCGLEAAVRRRLAREGVAAVIHCAGLTRFGSHLADEAQRHNLEGTRNVHALSRALDAGQFHHVSTAFVAGDASGTFDQEALDRGQGFHNPYEASKFAAELHLRQVHRAGEVLRIHRPSIVVGGHPLGLNQGASTVYTFLKALHFLRCCWRRDPGRMACWGVEEGETGLHLPMRVEGDPGLTVNLVSIDQVVEGIAASLDRPRPGLSSRTILGQDYTLERLRHEFSRAMGITGIRLVDAAAWREREMTPIERNFRRATASYLPYLRGSPRFPDCEKAAGWPVDPGRLARQFRRLLEDDRAGLGSQAMELLQVRGPEDYFHCLLDRRVGHSFLERIRFIDCRARFLVEDIPPFDRILHFRGGEVRYCDPDEREWDFCYRLDRPLFEAIVRGEEEIRRAFFAGRVRINGDKEAALKFGFLFDDHCRHLEQRVLEEVCA